MKKMKNNFLNLTSPEIAPILCTEVRIVPKDVQLLKVGEFLFEDGEKIQITTELLNSFVNNFNSNVRAYGDGKLPIDYFHDNDKIAAGWINSVHLTDDGSELWVNVQWTPKAEKMLADGELRYISAEFHFDYQHNEGGAKYGPTLFGAGLTNRPFIKGMKPVISLSEEQKRLIRLKNSCENNEDNATMANELTKPKEDLLMGKKDEDKKETVLAEGAAAAAEMPPAKPMMDLPAAMAKIAELEAKIAEMQKGQTDMADALKKKEEMVMQAEQEKTFLKMLNEGKAVEAQREAFMSKDLVKFAELAEPVNLKANGQDGTKEAPKKDERPAVDQIISLAEKLSKEENISMADAQSKVLKQNVELRKQYEKESNV